MQIINLPAIRPQQPAWNKGRIVGQKRPLLPKHVWAIRVRLKKPKSSPLSQTANSYAHATPQRAAFVLEQYKVSGG